MAVESSHGRAEGPLGLLERAGFDVWGHVAAFVQSGGQIQIKRGTPSDATGGGGQRALKAAGIEAEGIIRTHNNYDDDRAAVYVGNKP